MKKNTILMVVLVMALTFAMIFSGCGDEAPTDATKAPGTNSAVTITTQKPTEKPTEKATADTTADSTDDTTAVPTEEATLKATEQATQTAANNTTKPTAKPTEKPTAKPTATQTPSNLTVVYLDQMKGADTASGAKNAPVKTIEKAFALLSKGGTIYVEGTYVFPYDDSCNTADGYVIILPETNGKVTITSTNKSDLSIFSFEAGMKTTVQCTSPVEFNNMVWYYDHTNTNGKVGTMNIYSGPELVFGDNMSFECVNTDGCVSKPKHENCVCIRGGWHRDNCKGTIYTGNDIKITVLSGALSYINGGNADGFVPVGNSEINIGGTAEIYQRLQIAGSNGGDVTGNVTVNITGGKIGFGGSEKDENKLKQYGLVLIGHGINGYVAEIGGNVTVNIKGGNINSIHTARTDYEVLKGNLSINISSSAKIGEVYMDASKVDASKTHTLTVPNANYDISKFGNIWDSVKYQG